MNTTNRISEGLSFDDVLIRPAKSEVLPREVDTSTRLTRNIPLQITLLSAAMDTVTEARLAIAIAQEGGLGVIHKNLTIDEQASEVDRVKRSQAGIITAPITLRPHNPVQDAEDLMALFHVSGVPIVDEHGRLVGLLTNRDRRFLEDLDVPIESVMTKDNLVTVPPGTTLERAKELLHKHRIEKLPIVAKDGALVGLITIKDIMKARDYPSSCKDDMGRLRVGAALGVGPGEIDRARALIGAKVDVLVVDTAHGHTKLVLETVRQIKEAFPEVDLVGGNVVTREGAADLIAAGVDAIKVGVGPGSICTTRVIAGAGMPQLSAIMEVAEVAREKGVPVIADGGIKYSGDIVKAIAAGADSVDDRAAFALPPKAPRHRVARRPHLQGHSRHGFRGRPWQRGSKTRYMQFEEDPGKLVPEGIEGRVPFRGPLADYVHQLIGGLRSGMGYSGCRAIADLQTKTQFVRVTASGIRESHPHDVTITEDAPNYQVPR